MLVLQGDRVLLLLRVRCLLQKVSAALLPACLLACQENSFYLACGTSAGAGPWCVSERAKLARTLFLPSWSRPHCRLHH